MHLFRCSSSLGEAEIVQALAHCSHILRFVFPRILLLFFFFFFFLYYRIDKVIWELSVSNVY